MRELMFEIPSNPPVEKIVITKEDVLEKRVALTESSHKKIA
jgi:ATP-dependent protease Clp ATPase subunit